MTWNELKAEEVKTSKGVTLKVSISESDDGKKIFGIRKWIQRNGGTPIPTRDGFAVTLSDETIEQLIEALKKIQGANL
jgi:hypothetical protein